MAVPKRKTSKAVKHSRRTHKDRVGKPNLTLCVNPECGAPVLPHRACLECGTIRRRKGHTIQVIAVIEESGETKE